MASTANGLWMSQIGRNVTDAVDGILTGKRYLTHDRDPLFTAEFLSLLANLGVQSVKLPPHSPNLNAVAERFVRSIKESCLDRLILFGEAGLRKAIQNFILHYHVERNHQSKGNKLFPRAAEFPQQGIVRCEERLGGLLSTITENRHEGWAAADPIARLLFGRTALRGAGGYEADNQRALVLVASSTSVLGDFGPQRPLYTGWLSVALYRRSGQRRRSLTIRPNPPQLYLYAAMLCFLLFTDNLVGRMEVPDQRIWFWLRSGRWQLLLVFGILSVVRQLLFWSEAVCPSHPSTRRA